MPRFLPLLSAGLRRTFGVLALAASALVAYGGTVSAQASNPGGMVKMSHVAGTPVMGSVAVRQVDTKPSTTDVQTVGTDDGSAAEPDPEDPKSTIWALMAAGVSALWFVGRRRGPGPGDSRDSD